jgi:acetyl-CoA synthetase
MNLHTVWQPSADEIKQTNLYALMQQQGLQSFPEVHQWSVQNRESFWEYTVKRLGVCFQQPYTQLLDVSSGLNKPRWLVGATLNIAESCFQPPLDRPAICTLRQNGVMETWTVAQLDSFSNRIANAFTKAGLKKGDAVAIVMAMTAEVIALYVAILKIGGIVISIPESFAPEEIQKRLRIGEAKWVCTQDVLVRNGKSLPIYAKICEANAPKTLVFGLGTHSSLRTGDLRWEEFMESSHNTVFTPVACSPHDVINILFSSGTTGEPKAIPWDHTTAIKAASDGHYHQDIRAGDVVCWPTSLGWMMGPWLVFSAMLNRACIALYEGSPLERGFCEFVQNARVTMLGIVPSIVKNWRASGCANELDWQSLRCFSSSGEASNANDYAWLMRCNQPKNVLKPIIEYCGGTEIGGGYLAGNLLTDSYPSEFNGKSMGIDFVVLHDDATPCSIGEVGEAFLIPPSLGLSSTLLNGDNDAVYYAQCPVWQGVPLRRHGDRIIVLDEHRFQSDGRADNTMNLGGIKIGSVEIERVVNAVAGVIETAAIGIAPKEGGSDRLVIFAVVTQGTDVNPLCMPMQQAIKQHLNPLFLIHDVVKIDILPRTASNKVMHRELRDLYRKTEK